MVRDEMAGQMRRTGGLWVDYTQAVSRLDDKMIRLFKSNFNHNLQALDAGAVPSRSQVNSPHPECSHVFISLVEAISHA